MLVFVYGLRLKNSIKPKRLGSSDTVGGESQIFQEAQYLTTLYDNIFNTLLKYDCLFLKFTFVVQEDFFYKRKINL